MTDEKKTECVRLHLPETLFNDLARMASEDDRAMSEFIGRILLRYVYGHGKAGKALTGRDDA